MLLLSWLTRQVEHHLMIFVGCVSIVSAVPVTIVVRITWARREKSSEIVSLKCDSFKTFKFKYLQFRRNQPHNLPSGTHGVSRWKAEEQSFVVSSRLLTSCHQHAPTNTDRQQLAKRTKVTNEQDKGQGRSLCIYSIWFHQ